MLKEISKFIEGLALGPPWDVGVNMFAGHVPVKNSAGSIIPVRYLAVLENAGSAQLMDVGGVVTATPPLAIGDPGYWPEYAEKAVQFLNRAKSYFVGWEDAKELFDYLDNTAGWMLPIVDAGPQYSACVINAYSQPAPIENPGKDGFYKFSTNYVWKIEQASCGA